MEGRNEAGGVNQGQWPFDLPDHLEARLKRYEHAFEGRLEKGPLDPQLAGQNDDEAGEVAESITNGLVHPAETKGYRYDFGFLAARAVPLIDRVDASPPCKGKELDPAKVYLAIATDHSEGVESRVKNESSGQSQLLKDVPGEMRWPCLQEIIAKCRSAESPALGPVLERFIITLGADAINRTRSGALRLFMLAKLISQVQPSEGTLHQVGLPCGQFVWGFDRECAIICRAVLEAAFKELVVKDSVVRAAQRPGIRRLGFEACGALLCEREILAAEALGAVRQVGRLAEKAVQGRLLDPEWALEAVLSTMMVLEQIEDWQAQTRSVGTARGWLWPRACR